MRPNSFIAGGMFHEEMWFEAFGGNKAKNRIIGLDGGIQSSLLTTFRLIEKEAVVRDFSLKAFLKVKGWWES
jgi:hypothetical protein